MLNDNLKFMSDTSKVFYTQKGLRHGDSLACIIFKIAVEKVVRDSNINSRNTILQRSIQMLAYAGANIRNTATRRHCRGLRYVFGQFLFTLMKKV